MNAMTDDQIASERIKNAENLNRLETAISSRLGKLKDVNGFLAELLHYMASYMFELRRWQKLHDNRRG